MIFFTSQRVRLTAIFFTLFTVLVFLLLWGMLFLSQSSQEQRLNAREDLFLEFIGKIFHKSILIGEFAEAQLSCQDLLQDFQIGKIIFADHRNIIVVSTSYMDIGEHFVLETYTGPDWHIKTIVNPTGTLGTVAVNFSHEMVGTRELQKNAILMVLPIMLVVAAVSWLLGTLFSRRLELLASAVRKVAEGQLDVAVSVGGRDEIGRLGNMINKMIGSLRQLFADLKESEDRFRLIADSMPQFVWTADAQGVLDYRNSRLQEIEVMASSGKSFVHCDDKKETRASWLNAVASGLPYRIEHRLLNDTGTYHWYLSLAVPLRKPGGDIVKWYGTSTDIEELRQLREKLTKNEMLLRQTEALSKIGGWEYDVDAKEINWTPETYRIHGVSMGESPERAANDLVFYSPEEKAKIDAAMKKIVVDGGEFDIESSLITENGLYRRVRHIGRAELENGKVRRVFGLLEDVTDRRQQEETMKRINEELLTVNRIITVTATKKGVTETLEHILPEIVSLAAMDGGVICLLKDNDRLSPVVSFGTAREIVKEFAVKDKHVGGCLCGDCAKSHKPNIMINRAEVQAVAINSVTGLQDLCYHESFPLMIGDRCLGVICLFSQTAVIVNENKHGILEVAASQIAIAVDNALMLENIGRQAAVLEAKVKLRTKDLERSQQAMQFLLEDMAEAQKKMTRLNRQFVGRELRMRELKEEIAILKGQGRKDGSFEKSSGHGA